MQERERGIIPWCIQPAITQLERLLQPLHCRFFFFQHSIATSHVVSLVAWKTGAKLKCLLEGGNGSAIFLVLITGPRKLLPDITLDRVNTPELIPQLRRL